MDWEKIVLGDSRIHQAKPFGEVRNGIEVIEKCPGRSMDCTAIS
jgi:hypothetical protein